MSHLYAILAITGWVWTAIALVFIAVRLRRLRRVRNTPGFSVVHTREEQH